MDDSAPFIVKFLLVAETQEGAQTALDYLRAKHGHAVQNASEPIKGRREGWRVYGDLLVEVKGNE